jgi:FtsH-binding integral membrane protein
LYSFAQGISFGALFFILDLAQVAGSQYKLWDIIYIFAIGGGIFLISGVIGSFLSHKATITLSKFLLYISMSVLVLFVVLMFLAIFGVFASERFYLILYFLMGVIYILYIMWDFSVIRKSEQFMQMADDKVKLNFVLMFGYKLLVDFIGLIWTLIRLYLMLNRR